MANYSYEILRLNVAPHQNGLDNIVVGVNWRYQITEDSNYADIYYTTQLPSSNVNADSDAFIQYDTLTDEIVFSWIQQSEDMEVLQTQLQDKLNSIKSPQEIEKLPPWDMSVKYTGKEEYLIVVDNEPNNAEKSFGPLKWNTERANKLIAEKTDIDYQFAEDIIMYQKGLLPQDDNPLNVSDRLKVYKVEYTEFPTLDVPFEYEEGLQWVLDSGKAVGTYFVLERTVEEVKEILHNTLSEKSFNKQVEGVELTVQGTTVNVNSDMFNRVTLHQRWTLMNNDSAEEFKLNNGEWFTLTKSDVESVLIGINNHIKNIMAWESSVSSKINNSITIEDLKKVEI